MPVAVGGGGGGACDEVGSGGGVPAGEGPVGPNRPDRHIWLALKRHIVRERQRKKEEHEAEIEEERLRKEREARERQDVMTLGETREQIQQLEQKLTKLKEEKHQLFLQLKKVLNEDDNRKRQFKDSNEMMAPMGAPMGGNAAQIFLPPLVSQGNPNMGRPPLSAHMLNKSGGGMKRGRSPSPPYAQPQSGPHGSSPYMHHPHHKQQHSSPYQGPTHKMEEGRNREMARAVLWNKPSQYSSASQYGSGGGSSFYAMSQPEQRPGSFIYAPQVYHHHVQHHPPPKQVQHSGYHVEIKKESSAPIGLGEPHQPSYLSQPPPGMPPVSAPTSVPPPPPPPISSMRHPTQQQMMSVPPPIHQGNPKAGSITSGYPVRQQNPSVQNPNAYPNRHRY